MSPLWRISPGLIAAILALFPASLSAKIIEPTIVDVALYLLEIDNVDVRQQTFDSQFYFYLSWDGAHSPDGYEFVNGKSINRLFAIEEADSSGRTISCKIQGKFKSPMDVSDYPMDRQCLKIELEDFNYPAESLVYVVDEANTGYAADLFLGEWKLERAVPVITQEPSGPGRRPFSHYEYAVTIERNLAPFVIRIFIPLLIVVAMSMLTFFIPESNLESQVSIGVTSILSIIALHFAIRDQLPDVKYLTKADYLMIASYITIFLALLESVLVHALYARSRQDKSGAIDRACRLVFPGGYIAAVALIAIL